MAAVREVWERGPGLLTSILRHWVVVAVAAGGLGTVGYVLSAAQDTVYSASARLIFSDVGIETIIEDEEQIVPADQLRVLRNRANQVGSSEVLDRAVELLGPEVDAAAVHGAIHVWTDPNTPDAITIAARAASPELAAEVANAVGQAYHEFAAQLERQGAQEAIAELDRTIEQLESRLGGLDLDQLMEGAELEGTPTEIAQARAAAWQLVAFVNRRERLELAADLAGARGVSFEEAYPPYEPESPRPKRAGALALVVGAGLGSAYAYWREGRGGLARQPADVRNVLGVPLLAQVPRRSVRRWRRSTTPLKAIDSAQGQYEFLGTAVDHALSVRQGTALLVVGIRQRGEEAAVALNLAFVLCAEGRRVVLVDADLRRRRLTRLWRMADRPGLAEVAAGVLPIERVGTVAGLVPGGTWTFVPTGSPAADPYRVLHAGAAARLLDAIRSAGEPQQALRVVLHGPPVLDVADAGALAAAVDGVVLQVFKDTALEDVRQAGETLRMAGGQLLGFVFVGGRVKGARQRARPTRQEAASVRPVGAVR